MWGGEHRGGLRRTALKNGHTVGVSEQATRYLGKERVGPRGDIRQPIFA